MSCEPRFEQKSLIVEGFQQRGIIRDTKLLNTCPSPTVYPTYNGQRCPNPSAGFNWYTSCLPFGIGPDRLETTSLSQIQAVHVAGPSLGEGQVTPGNYIYIVGYTGSADAATKLDLPYLPNITQGCNLKSGGPITGVTITSSGIGIRDDGLGFTDLSGDGSGANFAQTITAGRLTSVRITAAGDGYKVGNSFKSSFLSFGGGAQGGTWEVTSVGTSSNSVNGPAPINWWIVDPRQIGNAFGGPGNYLYPTDGYAIGDIFEIQVPGENSKNTNARIEVTAIDVTNNITSNLTLSFTVEKDVGLIWDDTSLNRVVDLVVDYDRSVDDQVLLESADLCFEEFLWFADRKPTGIEFEYFTKQIYDAGGVVTQDITDLLFETLGDEVFSRLLEVVPECIRIEAEDQAANQAPDGGECIWDRNTFYQGTGTSAGYNIQLKDLWDFLGQPAGPSRAGQGSDIDELVCPKPDSGQIQDLEPDISDFAGMRLWRWTDCGTGNLGGYQEINVPCPGPEEGCENPIVEDNLAVYNSGAVLTWNNGDKKGGNFVKTPKGTISSAITNQYIILFSRQPEQAGLRYWADVTEQTQTDQYAEYWSNGIVRWANGTSSVTPLVKQALTANAQAINAKYFEILGRPAEPAGLNGWANEANSIGIENTLNNIEIAAANELDRGGATYAVGIDRTLELIAEFLPQELARGGVSSFKLFCQSQVSKQINLEYFRDTRLPPRYGSLSSTAPQISATQLADTNYLRYNPSTQTDLVGSFTTSTGQQTRKFSMAQDFSVSWGTVTGDLYGDERMPRIEKAIKATLYSTYNGAGDLKHLEFMQYTDNNLQVLQDYTGVAPNTNDACGQPGYGGAINVSYLEDSLSLMSPNWGWCNLTTPQSSNQIDKSEADSLAFNETSFGGNKYFWRVEAYFFAIDRDTGQIIPDLTKTDVFLSRTDNQTMRFISAYNSSPEQCPNGTKLCPNGSVICVEDSCQDDPIDDCTGLSISCGGDNNLQVETNKPTTIRFSYRINGAQNCSTKGSAKVSIRRFWPCPIFGPAPGDENAWVKDANGGDIVKRNVSIVNGEAIYDLPVNTSKDDYLATSYGDQTVDDPGSCHWIYVAYWEVEGMSSTSIRCDSTAWQNPGCFTDEGAFTQLPEVLCIQKQNCTGSDRKQIILGPTKQTGSFTALEVINPYPDPRLVKTLSQNDGNRPGEENPATVNGNNWNWYYDCPPENQTDFEDDAVPGEQWYFYQITGNGKGGKIRKDYVYYNRFTNGPDGRVDFTEGCVDSGGDFIQLYVDGIRLSSDGDGGDGYAVGDILEFRPQNMDPKSTPIRFRVTEINPTSTIGDCSQASWANEFTSAEMDPNQNCLPYCSTSQSLKFYWQKTSPEPGVNCSSGGAGANQLTNLGSADCSDCPVCEQTIQVTIGDTTNCGALKFPEMREDGAGLGINNGSFKVGTRTIKDPNAPYPSIDNQSLKLYTKTDGAKWIPIDVANWVTVAPARVNSLSTLGVNNAVIFGEEDFEALKEICCDGTDCINQGVNWDCQQYCPQGLCYDELDSTPLVDCDGKMRVVAQWYWRLTYKNSETGIVPMPFYQNWDTPDEQQVRLIPTDYYPDSAGNNTNGVPLGYSGEISNGSYFEGGAGTYIPYSNDLRKVEIFLKIQASNDEFGNEKYDPPPSGFNEDDFGTDSKITSSRFPWFNSGKDSVFSVGGFEIGETANLPKPLDNWSMELNGCESAQVWTPRWGGYPDVYYCGDPNSDNFYGIRIDSGFNAAEEFGKVNGEEFAVDCYIGGCSCRAEGESTSKNFNHVTGEGQECPRSFCPEHYSSEFSDCWPISTGKLNVSGNITAVDNGDYVRQPQNPNTGVKLVWYVNGKVVSKGAIGGASTNSPSQTCFFADRNEYWEDICASLTDENATYTVTVYALINNRQNVLKEGPPGDADGYSILQRGDSVAPMSLTTKNNDGETPVVLPPLPLGQNITWLDGDAFQVILGTASCNIKGNNGSGSKELTGLQNPQFTLSTQNNNFTGGLTNFGQFGAFDICNPDCCNDPNPGTNCGEGYDALLDICGAALCGGTSSGSGTIKATVTNLPGAWPTIPGTSDRVEGVVRYQWAKQNDSGQYVNITGANESSTPYVADGKNYRCTVTFDLAGKVPQGYKARPEKTSSSKIFTSQNVDLQDCNGVLIPITEPCDDDPVQPCVTPTYAFSPVIDIRTINAFKPGESGTPYASITVRNNTTPTIVASPLVQGMANNTLVSARCRLLKNGQVAGTLTDMDIVFGNGDIYTFNVSFPVTGNNETAQFGARYVIDYKCPDGEEKQAVFRDPKTAQVIWNTSGTGDDDGDDDFPLLLNNPSCFYTNDKKNSQNCGSYLGQWIDQAGFPAKYYYQTARSTSIDDRGEEFSPNNVEQYASCQFCPPADCPTLNITRVNQVPVNVEKNQAVDLSVVFTFDYRNFQPASAILGGTTTYTWQGDGVTPATIAAPHTATIRVGPYITEGVKNLSITVNKFYLDPTEQCGGNDGILNYKVFSDTYEFTINVGDTGPVDPDPEDPEVPEFFNVRITGPSELTLVNGSVSGTWKVDYQLSDGIGYIPNTRPVVAKWDGDNSGQFAPGGLTYTRTFSSPSGAQGINIPVELNKLFCPQDVGAGRCIQDNILNGNPPLSNAEKKWVVSTPVSKNVVIKGEDVGNEEPTIRTNVTANKTSGVAPVTITFTAQTQVDDGDWVRTPEPAARRYDIVNKNYSTGIVNRNATLTETWTRTFTEAFSGTIGSRFRRNYCPPGTASTSNCTGKRGFLADDHININITDPAPTGNKPSARLLAPEYYDTNNIALSVQADGCVYVIANRRPVNVVFKVSLTQGTGDFVYSKAIVLDGNGNKDTRWNQVGSTLVRGDVNVSQTSGNTFGGFRVQFQKSNGDVIHTERVGNVDWCVEIISGIGPGPGPGGPGPGIQPF